MFAPGDGFNNVVQRCAKWKIDQSVVDPERRQQTHRCPLVEGNSVDLSAPSDRACHRLVALDLACCSSKIGRVSGAYQDRSPVSFIFPNGFEEEPQHWFAGKARR